MSAVGDRHVTDADGLRVKMIDVDRLLRLSCTPRRLRWRQVHRRGVHDSASAHGAFAAPDGSIWWCATNGHQLIAVEASDDGDDACGLPFALREFDGCGRLSLRPAGPVMLAGISAILDLRADKPVSLAALRSLAPRHVRSSARRSPHVVRLAFPGDPEPSGECVAAASLRALHALDDGPARAVGCFHRNVLVVAGSVGGARAVSASLIRFVGQRGLESAMEIGSIEVAPCGGQCPELDHE